MQLLKTLALASAILAAVTLLACSGGDGNEGDGDGDKGDGPSPSPASSTAVEPDNLRNLFPPLEGPERPVTKEVINYWEDPEFDLPDPAGLPALPPHLSSLEPPEDPVCPEDWVNFERPLEAFRLCYPDPYVIEGHGFVTAGVEERWYAVGFFDFEGEVDLGHVSVYVTGPFNQPVPYVAECDQAYRVTIAGMPASVCPDYDGRGDEKIIAYHVRVGDLDYFVNAVPAQVDASASPTAVDGIEFTLLQIVHSFELLEPLATESPSEAPEE